ncbi:MAG: hypothetical protein AMS21_09855, partial [Gemmatimonas sp. SG8_38_2]
HLLGQGAEPLFGDGGQERRLVGEMMVGCHVADPRFPGDGAHAERRDALGVDDLEGGVEERPAQVTVVVGPVLLVVGDGGSSGILTV